MALIIFVSLSYLVILCEGQVAGGCPAGFHADRESCYFVSTTEGSWADSRKSCQAKGGQLANILDQDTQAFLAGLVKTTDKRTNVSIHTRNDYKYHYLHDLGVQVGTHTSVTFNVRACNDAHIALSSVKGQDSSNTYEIVIGGWSDSESVIRDCKQCSHQDEVHHSLHPLSCILYHPFWISWSHNVIRVGTGNDVGVSQFMSWNDTGPHAVNFIAVSTGFGSDGDWIFPVGTYMPGKFWVGSTYSDTAAKWLWLPEMTPSETFTAWAPNQPNTTSGRCMALDMHNNMQWRAEKCVEMRNYICQRPIEDVGVVG